MAQLLVLGTHVAYRPPVVSLARSLVMMVAVSAGTGCSAVVDVGDSGAGHGGTGGGTTRNGDDLARLAAAICERQAACGCEEPYGW